MTDETIYAVVEKVNDSREYIIIAKFAFRDDAVDYYYNLSRFEDLNLNNFKIVKEH